MRPTVILALDERGDIIGVYTTRKAAEKDIEDGADGDEDLSGIRYQEWPVRGEEHDG